MAKQRKEDWRHKARCRNEEPELFFSLTERGPAATDQIDQAIRVCRRCPVQPECLSWALESGQDAGVWGGMSAIDRRELNRRTSSSPTPGKRGQRRSPISPRSPGFGLSEAQIADELDT